MAIMMVLAALTLGIGFLIYDIIKLPIVIYYIVIFIILAVAALWLVDIAPKKITENMERL